MADRHPSMRSDFYVYALLRGDTGVPFYVGKGRGRRVDLHEWEARRGQRGYKAAIIRQMIAHGAEVIKIRLHDNLTEAVAHKYEVALIAAIGRSPSGPLANLTDGCEGTSGWAAPPEWRAAAAERRRGKKHSPESVEKTAAAKRGQIISADHRAKIAAKLRGTKASLETRAKLSQARRGRGPSPEALANSIAARVGKKMSPEARAKMSKAKAGRKLSPEHVAKLAFLARRENRSPETLAKMSAARLGKKRSLSSVAKGADTQRGKKHSPERIAKMVAGRWAKTLRCDATIRDYAAEALRPTRVHEG